MEDGVYNLTTDWKLKVNVIFFLILKYTVNLSAGVRGASGIHSWLCNWRWKDVLFSTLNTPDYRVRLRLKTRTLYTGSSQPSCPL